MMPSLKPALSAIPLLILAAGCSAPDDDVNWGGPNSTVSAEGQAQEGKISIKAPGLDLAISLPKEMTGEAKVGRDSKVLYPGATLAGMAIAAGEGGKGGKGGDTDVEMRFRTADPLEKVAAWYRDPARGEGFRLTGQGREGSDYVFTGVQRRDRHAFRVRIGAGEGGGTEGRLRVHHQD
jgi:hypothetical protein